jgi:hypothetical protein
MGRTESRPDLKPITSETGLAKQEQRATAKVSTSAKWRAQKLIDTADVVREAIFQQSSSSVL